MAQKAQAEDEQSSQSIVALIALGQAPLPYYARLMS
jgi:hypothetical protein